MCYVIALCHQKGGVAKTTTTLSLAASLVERGIETLVIDLDPQANLTTGLGLDPEAAPYTLADVLQGEIELRQAWMESSVPGLDVVPSNSSLVTLARQLYQMPQYEFCLRHELEKQAVEDYQVVLLDCPPSVGSITINALTAADLLLIPTQCEYYSIQALTDMFELVNVIRDKTNPDLSYRLLVTMFDARGNFHSQMLEQMREFFKEGLLETTIGFDTKLRESQLFGRPITIHASHSRSAGQYRQLAEELLTYVRTKSHLQTA